jgi:hypothetical protein
MRDPTWRPLDRMTQVQSTKNLLAALVSACRGRGWFQDGLKVLRDLRMHGPGSANERATGSHQDLGAVWSWL